MRGRFLDRINKIYKIMGNSTDFRQEEHEGHEEGEIGLILSKKFPFIGLHVPHVKIQTVFQSC
jgi:hypothetical protein